MIISHDQLVLATFLSMLASYIRQNWLYSRRGRDVRGSLSTCDSEHLPVNIMKKPISFGENKRTI